MLRSALEADSSLRHEDIRSLRGRIIERDVAECDFGSAEEVLCFDVLIPVTLSLMRGTYAMLLNLD